MEACIEPIHVRIARMNNLFLGRSDGISIGKSILGREGLLDALLVLYDECNNESLKTDPNIAAFINKFRSHVLEIRRNRVNISDFDVKAIIGRGHFGEVQLVTEKQTGNVYAMKRLRKVETLGSKRASFEEERDIMALSTSPWLTSLQYAFQDMQNLYLVMEFHPGGDLVALSERFGGTLQENMARFYLAEMVMSIKSLHQMNYVHRDIKPDNFLLDRCGHIKLADFGSAAKLTGAGVVKAQMPVGTPEYIAPEVLSAMEAINRAENGSTTNGHFDDSYGIECDYWSLGIVAYEMIFGRTPFGSKELTTTYKNIQSHRKSLQYPEAPSVSKEFKNMVSGLLTRKNSRLGYDQLVRHPFFTDIDWESLRDSVPFYVPQINGEDDTSNFAKFERITPVHSIEDYKLRKEFSGKNLPFVGFTYSKDIVLVQSSSPADRLERRLTAKKKEAQEQAVRIHMLEEQSEQYKDQINVLERRVLQSEQKLKLVEEDRQRLENDLSNATMKQKSLQRSLDLEIQETTRIETTAMNLVKSAKQKLEEENNKKLKAKDKKIQQLNDEMTKLITQTNNLTSRLDRKTDECSRLQDEIVGLKEIIQNHKANMVKSRKSHRDSVIDVQNRLGEIAANNQTVISELQTQLEEEKEKFSRQTSQLEKQRYELEKQFEACSKETERLRILLQDKVTEQENKDQMRIAELERKLREGCFMCPKLQEKLVCLETELSESVVSFERHENAIALKEIEIDSRVEKERKEKAELKQKLEETRNLEQNQSLKLNELQKLLESLKSNVSCLQEENSKLREHNSSLSKQRCRSSFGTAVVPASPRLSGTQTTVTAAVATQSEPTKPSDDSDESKLELKVLKATVERLEKQLDKQKEISIEAKQSVSSARSDLWKKERELSDAKLDLRITERELKTVQEAITALKDENKKLAEALEKEKDKENEKRKEDKDRISKQILELSQLRHELSRTKLSLSTASEALEKERDALKLANSNLESSKLREIALQADIAAAQKQIRLLEDQVEVLKKDLKKTDQNCGELREEKKKIQSKLEETSNAMQQMEINSNLLKSTCSMLEEQLEDYDRLTSSHEDEKARLVKHNMKLQTDLETAQEHIRLAKQEANEEKSLRLKAEVRLPMLETQLADRNDELTKAQQQIAEYKSLAENLTSQLNSTEDGCAQKEIDLHAAQRQINHLQAEIVALKEESTCHLTRIHVLKETNYRLDQELQESIEEGRSLQEQISQLEAKLDELKVDYTNREVKSSSTIHQQTKLINHLQAILDERNRRKNPLDRLFGKKEKENQMNMANLIAGLKDPETANTSESKIPKRSEFLYRSSTRTKNNPALEKLKLKVEAPVDPLSPAAARHLVQSPGCQDTPTSVRKQTSMQRMHHNIPHRFESKLVMRVAKCAACQVGVPFGRQASLCQECGMVAHFRCTSLLPSTCGLPPGFARHFSQRWKKAKEEGTLPKNDTPAFSENNIEGWLKVPRRGKSSWERSYVRLEGAELLFFSHEPKGDSKNLAPTDRFALCPDWGVAKVNSVDQSEIGNTAKSDIPFIIKIEVAPRTTCWTATIQYLMASNAQEKERWVQAINAVVRGELEKREEPCRRYAGQVIIRLPEDSTLEVNCVYHLNSQIVVIGATEGLFSYNLGKGKAKTVKINGIGPVFQMTPMPHIGMIVMISEKAHDLVYCDIRQLLICAEAAECSQATLTVNTISSTPNNAEDDCLHLLAVSNLSQGKTRDVVCAASSKRLLLLRWSTSGSCFQQIKSLDTQEPCSCILFTPHSIILGCDKFFEIDIQDFSVDAFLDASDKSLAYVTRAAMVHNTNQNYPMAVFDVSSSSSRTSPEYLVCFYQLGVFVDQYGRRSREDDIKWAHVPFTFAYRKPFLFVFHFSSVEVMRIAPTSFIRNLNDSSSTITECPPSTVIQLTKPEFLGNTDKPGGIYTLNVPEKGVEIVSIDGNLACLDELGYSCSSLDTVTETREKEPANPEEFSFTSSLVDSLDEDGIESVQSSSQQESDWHSAQDSDSQQFSGTRHVRFGVTHRTEL